MYIYFINKCCGSLDFNRNRLRFSLVYSIGLVWFGLAWQRRQKNMFFMTSVVCPRAIHFPSTKYKKKLNKSRAKLQLHPKPSAYGVDHLRFIYFFFAISYCLFACSVARAADAPTLAHTHTHDIDGHQREQLNNSRAHAIKINDCSLDAVFYSKMQMLPA